MAASALYVTLRRSSTALARAMTDSLRANKERFPRAFYERLHSEWDGGRALLEPDRVFAGQAPAPDQDLTETERERRLQALNALQGMDGPEGALWRHAERAAGPAGDMRYVDWPKVHLAVLRETIEELGQDPGAAIDALILHSPGAVTQETEALVRSAAGTLAGARSQDDPMRLTDRNGI